MARHKIVTIVIIFILLAAVFLGVREMFITPVPRTGPSHTGNGIGLVTIDGMIAAGGSGIFSAGQGDYLLGELRRAADDPIRALVVRINSPGGTAASSQEIYSELMRVREKGKIVVVSMGDLAASGGYMVACAADHIVANPATLTGSIGVIMDVSNFEGLYDLLGIEYDVVKSGQFKDMYSPARSLNDLERELLENMIADIYEQFIDTIVDGRGMDRDDVLPFADGRLLTGRQALDAGFVDELGTLYDAIERASQLAGIEGEPRLYHYGVRNLWSMRMPGFKLDFSNIIPGLERDSLFLR